MLMKTTAITNPRMQAPIPFQAPSRNAREVESLISAPPSVLWGGISAIAICGMNTHNAPITIETTPALVMLASDRASTVTHT